LGKKSWGGFSGGGNVKYLFGFNQKGKKHPRKPVPLGGERRKREKTRGTNVWKPDGQRKKKRHID